MESSPVNKTAVAIADLFLMAQSQYSAGKLLEAQASYEAIIAAEPNHAEALHNLGLLFAQQREYSYAVEPMKRLLKLVPDNPIYLSNYGNMLQGLQSWAEAVPLYLRAIELSPNYFDAHYNLGNALMGLGKFDLAIKSFQQSLLCRPGEAEAYLNCGNAYGAQGKHELALANYEKAIDCNILYLSAYNNRAYTLIKLGRGNEVVIKDAQHDQSEQNKLYEACVSSAQQLAESKSFVDAVEMCKKALKINWLRPEAFFFLGTAYVGLNDFHHALRCFLGLVESEPNNNKVNFFLGLSYVKILQPEAGIKFFQKALEIEPQDESARILLADALFAIGKHHESLKALQGLSLPLQPLGLMQFFKTTLGDWSNYEEDRIKLLDYLFTPRYMGLTEDPWHLMRVTDDPELQKKVAQNFFTSTGHGRTIPAQIAKRTRKGKIKIAYVSPDFSEHAVSHLTTELFASHSKKKFETYAFSLVPCDQTSDLRAKLIKSFDHFIEVKSTSDAEVAKLIRDHEIDIAIDLAGITQNARMGIFANRAAPIQVNYLGFAATVGTPSHDYIIADPIVIPPESRQHYVEKVVYLPCMMPFNTHLRLPQTNISRDAVGLPSRGFIFCAFNQPFKFTPATLDAWMRILSKTPESILWLGPQCNKAINGIKSYAQERGVDPKRIILASRLKSIEHHLARLSCADLFLDSFPYNAHTSAIDALWTGVPLITQMGHSFASRLAGSLLKSVGLENLIVSNLEQYEAMAVDLAMDAGKLAAVKLRLIENRQIYPLFNMKLYVDHFEDALSQMYERYHADLSPEHITTV